MGKLYLRGAILFQLYFCVPYVYEKKIPLSIEVKENSNNEKVTWQLFLFFYIYNMNPTMRK